MAQESIRELLDLCAINQFYLTILEAALEQPIPVPHEVVHAECSSALGEALDHTVSVLRRWLGLLDLAITPPLLRDSLLDSTSPQTAEALLRYFILKRSPAEADRDKTDWVTTFLYRARGEQPRAATSAQDPSPGDAPPFEQEIRRLTGQSEPPPLPQEHRQLVREFHHLRLEIEDFRYFDQLMDSGIIQRVRELKQSFAGSFYHPAVLSTFAEHNVCFGDRFDDLFRAAARQIKEFATTIQQQGGSSLTRVEGDITVKHLMEVEENEILQQEYGRAQESLHRVSKFKKAVDLRSKSPDAKPHVPMGISMLRQPPPAAPHSGGIPYPTAMEAPTRAAANTVEESKIRAVQDSIRYFVRVADPDSCHIVPLQNGNVSLSEAEAGAFRADFGAEKSFRAEFAHTVVRIVALQARMIAELFEYRAKEKFAYFWKPHADSLAYLLKAAQRSFDSASQLLEKARQRGLTDKANALHASLEKLRAQSQAVAATLKALDVHLTRSST